MRIFKILLKYLGVLEDCQEYLLKLFSSITEKGSTTFEITKPTKNIICMENVLPSKFRCFINDEKYLTESESIHVSQRNEENKTIYHLNINKNLDLLTY